MQKKTEALKTLHGTSRHDRLSEGLKLETDIPVCPINLSGEAQVIEDDLCQKLFDLRVLRKLDGYVLSMFCETYVRWNNLRQFLQENGDSYQSETGLCKIRPEVQSLKECLNSLDVLTSKLCISTGDSGKLTVKLPEETNALTEFLKNRRSSLDIAGK